MTSASGARLIYEHTWSGNWTNGRSMMACFQTGGTLEGYIEGGVSVNAVSTKIHGGRVGLFNNYNRDARHDYLRTISWNEGHSLSPFF